MDCGAMSIIWLFSNAGMFTLVGLEEGHLPECLPAYALAYRYMTLDTRCPLRSSLFCLSDVRAADEYICGFGSAVLKDAWSV